MFYSVNPEQIPFYNFAIQLDILAVYRRFTQKELSAKLYKNVKEFRGFWVFCG